MELQNTLLPFIEINSSAKPIGSVIWLHGLGADGNDFAPIVPELRLPPEVSLRFIFPHAPAMPVTINNGYVMPAWYDITSFDLNQKIDQQGIALSVSRVNDLIAHENERGIPTERIVLAGFSQGAVVALAAGLHSPIPLAGILALSGYLPFINNTSSQTTPIFLAHGTEDSVVPYQAGLMSYDKLQRDGFSVDWHSYPMAHGVCDQEIADIAGWLERIFS